MTCGGCSGAIERVLKKTDGALALASSTLRRLVYVDCRSASPVLLEVSVG